MKKWAAVVVLACAQFVMVLDSTVMNVSIAAVVEDLHTTVEALQTTITFYTLTMASLMVIGAKLGDLWGRRRAFVIGAIVYGAGSLITALSFNITTLFIGWSVVEGLGAVLVLPATAALVADNYSGRARVTAYAVIGAISGAGVAAGPLIGGFVTSFFSWRYVFAAEVVILALVLLGVRFIRDGQRLSNVRIDVISAVLSAGGLVLVVYAMLQSKEWGWLLPFQTPQVWGIPLTPFGFSIVPFLIVLGLLLLRLFWRRQQALLSRGAVPLVDVSMLSLGVLRSGFTVEIAQYVIIGGIFFTIPIYLQMTLGLDALQTGLRIFPLSLALILASFLGTRLARLWSPRRIVRVGQSVIFVSVVILLWSVSFTLQEVPFWIALFTAGAGLGLFASQLGNVTMSAVDQSRSSEIGGLQGLSQNLGNSLGTALIGSVLITGLSTSFISAVETSSLPVELKQQVVEASVEGVSIVPVTSIDSIAESAGVSTHDGAALKQIYVESQLTALRVSLFGLLLFSAVAMTFSAQLPNRVSDERRAEEGRASPSAS